MLPILKPSPLVSAADLPDGCFSLPTDYVEYEDAAEEFHPFIKFFATFDPKVGIRSFHV